MHSHSIVFVPYAAIKDIFTQPEPDGRRAKWIATLSKYDIEIRPTKLVKGQGIARLMAHVDFFLIRLGFSYTAQQKNPLITSPFSNRLQSNL